MAQKDNWKKALTFSYDDGVTQDIRLVELLNKYGMKGTFNLNSERLGRTNQFLVREGVQVSSDKIAADRLREVYAGHEVAAHTLSHPNLANMEDDAEIIRQVEEDRKNLSAIMGYEVVGMAYPGGGVNYTDHVADVIRDNTGIKYARTTVDTDDFGIQTDLYRFRPNVYHIMDMDRLWEMGKKFLESESDEKQILYIWGHAYEFDVREAWEEFEAFLQMMAGHEDIFYGTNREVLLDETGDSQ